MAIKKKRKKETKEPQETESLFFLGDKLNTPDLILQEKAKFQNWFIKKQYENPEMTFDQRLIQFAQKRSWGRGKCTESTTRDLMALRYAYLNIFNEATESYTDPLSKEILGEERASILQKYYENPEYHPADVRYVSKEQFLEAVRLQFKWNSSFGKEWEGISKTPFDYKTIADFLDRAEPLWKQLKKAEGTILCQTKRCLNPVPIGRQDKKYCSDQCRKINKSRKWRENNPEKKFEADVKYYTSLNSTKDNNR